MVDNQKLPDNWGKKSVWEREPKKKKKLTRGNEYDTLFCLLNKRILITVFRETQKNNIF